MDQVDKPLNASPADQMDELIAAIQYKNWEQMFSVISICLEHEKNHSRLYLLHKSMIAEYIEDRSRRGYSYDHINYNAIVSQIRKFKPEYCVGLLKNFRRSLVANNVDFDADYLDKEIKKSITHELLCSKKIGIKLVMNIFSYHTLASFISLLALTVLYTLFFIKAPVPWMEMVSSTTITISANSWINALLNAACEIILDTEGIEIKPISIIGAIVICAYKIVAVSILINYFGKKLLDRLGDFDAV